MIRAGLIALSLTASLAGITALCAVPAASPNPAPAPSADDVKFFETKIRPLLFDNCLSCHGDEKQMGGLRLDSEAALRKGSGTGPVIVGSDPEQSHLIRAVRYDEAIKMPPAGKLKPDEIAALTEWVRRGSPWPAGKAASAAVTPDMPISDAQRNFWSFKPVRTPAIPTVKNTSWVKNPIDAFVLSGLEKRGLAPAPPADKRTLIRRATYDLTGLPPTPEEVSAFLADSSPNAFAKVVDRLLASPRYGERWGRHWLDLVRYCDSTDARGVGSEGDVSEAWRYRDWVIDALNRDMPYAEFIKNQIAGDLLTEGKPEGFNREGTIATGLLAIGNWGNGDADKDKILTDIADDQVDVVSRAFMGLTVACARCHNHKFDPISTKDYYALAGIFFSTHILPKLTPKGAGENMLRIPLASPAELERRKQHAARIAELEKQVQTLTEQQRAEFAKSMAPQAAKYALAVWEYDRRPADQASVSLADFAAKRGLHAFALRQWTDFLGKSEYRLMTTAVRDILNTPGVHALKGPGDTPSISVNTTAEAKSLLTFVLPARSVSIHPGPTSGVAVSWKSPISGIVKITGKAADADPACGDGIAWSLQLKSPGVSRDLASGLFENGGSQPFDKGTGAANLAAVPVRIGDVIQLSVLPKGGHACDTTTVDLVISGPDGKTWDLTKEVVDDLPTGGNPHKDRYGNPAVWMFQDMGEDRGKRPDGPLGAAVAAYEKAMADKTATREAIEQAAAELGKQFDMADARSPFWINSPADSGVLPDASRQALAKLGAELDGLRKQMPGPLEIANGAQEGGVPESPHAGVHDVKVHIRGRYDRLGDLVPRRFPTIITSPSEQPHIATGSGRKELAEWLASPKHPLTARVMVNRVWQFHFGEGIVRTPSNFGMLGERPTHPELLDWLASEFMNPTADAHAKVQIRKKGQEQITTETQRHREVYVSLTEARRKESKDAKKQTQVAAGSFPLYRGGTEGGAVPADVGPNPKSKIQNPKSQASWSLKDLHRLIMLSNTYQQASEADPRTAKVDPDNRLFGKMNRRRLEAEAVRDSLLVAAGKLATKMGGVADRDFKTPRRTVYIMTIRSDRSGFGPLFDMADSTAQVDRRTVSTVAPQALYLLNSAFALEQTRALAKRVTTGMTGDDRARIRQLYDLLYGRPATAKEIEIGVGFLAHSRRAPTGRVAGPGAPDIELEAWTEYCQILLCANEFMYVD